MMGDISYKTILGIMVGIICALLCVISFILGTAHGKKQAFEALGVQDGFDDDGSGARKRSAVASMDNIDEVSEELNRERPKAPKSYEVVMNTEWTFPSGGSKASSNAYVENNIENENKVYFSVALDASPDEIIYTSPVLSVGERLKDISLDKVPGRGRHKATVIYHLLDDEGNEAGEVKAGVVIVIE